MTFQYIVMTTASIILIITLGFIGIALYRQKYHSDYPPVIAKCPDYWIDSSGNGSKCQNVQNLGNAICSTTMDFSSAQWSGQSGQCNKYTWAKSCNLTWDGISDNADLCGDDS